MAATLVLETMLSLLLLLASSSKISASYSGNQAFIQCFINQTHTPQNLYTYGSPSYTTVLRSSVQNLRFLISPVTTKPLLIVTPTTEAHVQASVICSRSAGLHIRVRSGGHDYEGMSYVSDAEPFIVVDLAELRSIAVDAEHTTAWVQAGATVGEVYYAVGRNNKTVGFPAGICLTIGVGGHFSGGGLGAMTRKYGLSADHIVDAHVVDADGKLLNRKTMGEDLFWAIRGGGAASFGIVTSFKLKLVAVPATVTACNLNKNLRQNATKLVERWQSVAPKFDHELLMRVIAQAIDDGEGGRTIQALFNSLYLGRKDELLGLMHKSFPELGLGSEDCNEMSWIESLLFFAGFSGSSPDVLLDRRPQYNSSFKAKSDFVRVPISEQGLEKIWSFLLAARDEPLVLILEPLGGRMDEISEKATPFPHRKGNLYNIQYFMRWFETDAAVTQRHLDWMRRLYDFMAPYVSKNPRAAYYNYKDIDLGSSLHGQASYSEAAAWGIKYFKGNFERLAYVKGKVDPGNFFRNEQSIPPKAHR